MPFGTSAEEPDTREIIRCSATISSSHYDPTFDHHLKPEYPVSQKPPIARRKPLRYRFHGDERRDDYAWLRDPDWQQVIRDPTQLNAEIRAYLEAENTHTQILLGDTQILQQALFDEFRGRIREDDSSVAAVDGDWAYYYRYRQGGEHPILCRRQADTPASAEQILLDGDLEAQSVRYFSIGDYNHSPDHRLFAYTVDTNGSECYELRIRCLRSGDWLSDCIPGCAGAFVWAADSLTLFYTLLDRNHRPCKVMRHRLGNDPDLDALVYEETDSGFFVGVDLTQSRRYIVIGAHDHCTSEVRLIDARQPESAPRLIAARLPGREYIVEHRGDQLWILTNADAAEDFKIVTTAIEHPQPRHWTEVVNHRRGTLITAFTVLADWLLRLELANALPRIVVRDIGSGEERRIAFDEEAYDLKLIPEYAFATDNLRFAYASMTTPQRIFDYDLRSGRRTLRKTQSIPSGHNPADYQVRRLYATAADDARIPISVLYRRDTPVDGSAPLLLYGYGAYGASVPATFSITRLSLIDRGFVYAIAHIRGGKECGYRWYRNGKLECKQNTFADFLVCARTLITAGYTRAGRITIHGGSAGGMLIGVCLNTAPELFHAAIAEVPFVDVLNTMCDPSLPLTPPEWLEWGNPIENPADYHRIAQYSPYDNVAARPYPHIIVTAGLTDPRVTYWEPAKWVARLRQHLPANRWLALHTNLEAGHGGAAGRLKRLREVALIYAFALSAPDIPR